MSRFLLSPAAQRDLGQIWDYTRDRWDARRADAYLRDVQRAIELIAANPRIGTTCDGIRPGYRRLAVESHVLFYRVSLDDVVDVVRVLHQRMDVDRHI